MSSIDRPRMLSDELDYHLPPELIATTPAIPRDAAKLMLVRRDRKNVSHQHIRDLPQLLAGPNDLMVVNQSKVLPAAFDAVRADTGGKVSGLYLDRPTPGVWQIMLKARGSLCQGETITLADDANLQLSEDLGGGCWFAQLHSLVEDLTLLHRIGTTPLPPYIRKERKARHEPTRHPLDEQRYNTVYAVEPGSVAAPTAGLHFTTNLLEQLAATGIQRAAVTLHVGIGTFAPIRTSRVEDHPIHSEQITIPAATLNALKKTRKHRGRIIVIGTTAVRALESLPPEWQDIAGAFTTNTNLLITPAQANSPTGPPPFKFRFTDALLTNFHLPRSTLLALVAALPEVGIDRLLEWYRQAIAANYRFYSYGDAMLIL